MNECPQMEIGDWYLLKDGPEVYVWEGDRADQVLRAEIIEVRKKNGEVWRR